MCVWPVQAPRHALPGALLDVLATPALYGIVLACLQHLTRRNAQQRENARNTHKHACSTSHPSGNKVDSLPLVANIALPKNNTGEDNSGPAPHP